ncbi:unnamed protein product [Candida verbasci]|uniref:2-dehydropantoate 2-reductase n=1 Tax=Candida verbasci TaxID=1227364 RepID=A0A9W4XMX2_9ASCO|nr:unnamed protein product [Candida verbasci]
MSSNLISNYFKQNPPTFYESIITHGIYKSDEIVFNHAAKGSMLISKSHGNNQSKMIDVLKTTKDLNVDVVPFNEFLIKQIQKFIVNCCINPLSALYDVQNGELLYGKDTLYLWKLIIKEAMKVLNVKYASEFEAIPESKALLNDEHLLSYVIEVCQLTSENSSSMRQDVRNLRKTEIDFLNGYVNFLGRKQGISTPINHMIEKLINTKLSIDQGIDKAAMSELLK